MSAPRTNGPCREAVKRLCADSRAMVAREPVVAWLGSIEAAMVLDQFCFWQDAAKGKWWSRTDQEVREWLHISQHGLAKARQQLEDKGLISKCRRGIPAKLHYLVNLGAVEAGLSEFMETRQAGQVRRTSSTGTHNKFCENAELFKRVTTKSTATALDLASGLRPSVKSRHEPAADAGGYVHPGAGSPNDQATATATVLAKSKVIHRTEHGWWIPRTGSFKTHEELVGFQGRTTNGVKAQATAKPTATATSKAQATSTAGSPTPLKRPAPASADRPAAGAEAPCAADPTPGRGNATKGPQRPRQRASRPTDPFFNLFGELVLRGQPTSRTRGLAGEFANRCVQNGVTERALRDWRLDLARTGDDRFLRSYNAWEMLVPWWEKRIGKYVQTPGQPSDIERLGGAGSFEKWEHIRYGIPQNQ